MRFYQEQPQQNPIEQIVLPKSTKDAIIAELNAAIALIQRDGAGLMDLSSCVNKIEFTARLASLYLNESQTNRMAGYFPTAYNEPFNQLRYPTIPGIYNAYPNMGSSLYQQQPAMQNPLSQPIQPTEAFNESPKQTNLVGGESQFFQLGQNVVSNVYLRPEIQYPESNSTDGGIVPANTPAFLVAVLMEGDDRLTLIGRLHPQSCRFEIFDNAPNEALTKLHDLIEVVVKEYILGDMRFPMTPEFRELWDVLPNQLPSFYKSWRIMSGNVEHKTKIEIQGLEY